MRALHRVVAHFDSGPLPTGTNSGSTGSDIRKELSDPADISFPAASGLSPLEPVTTVSVGALILTPVRRA